jgi:hypothetical protein
LQERSARSGFYLKGKDRGEPLRERGFFPVFNRILLILSKGAKMDNFRDLPEADDLETIAYQKSDPFCYSCYRTVKPAKGLDSPRCIGCGSDDLMRKIDGVACEWGIEWVVGHLIKDNLEEVNTDKQYHEMLEEVYPDPVKACGCELYKSQADIWKELDPIAYDCAHSAWLDGECKDDRLFTTDNGNTYYERSDLIAWVDENIEIEEVET